MAFDAEIFVEYMNEKLDGIYKIPIASASDETRIGYICAVFLKELRKRRGESNP
jgi:hypothetical protein